MNITCNDCNEYYTKNTKTFLVFATVYTFSIIITSILKYYKIKID